MNSDRHFAESLHIVIYHLLPSLLLKSSFSLAVVFFISYSQKAVFSFFESLHPVFVVSLLCFSLFKLLEVLLSPSLLQVAFSFYIWIINISKCRILWDVLNFNKFIQQLTLFPSVYLSLLFYFVYPAMNWILTIELTQGLLHFHVLWIGGVPGLFLFVQVIHQLLFSLNREVSPVHVSRRVVG